MRIDDNILWISIDTALLTLKSPLMNGIWTEQCIDWKKIEFYYRGEFHIFQKLNSG